MGSRTKSWLFGVAVILCLCAAAFGVTVPIRFNAVSVTEIAELFATIFVVTLFMERAQEVILTTVRARGSEQLELTIRKFKRVVQRQKKIAPGKVIEEHFYEQLEDARIEKMDYRAFTRVLALRLGLLFGLMNGLDYQSTGRIASLLGSLKIAHAGTQNHSFSREEFDNLFEKEFGYRF